MSKEIEKAASGHISPLKLLHDENPTSSQLILYQTEDDRTRLEVRMDKDIVCLSQNQMAELFETTK